jgi:hypothetical protein
MKIKSKLQKNPKILKILVSDVESQRRENNTHKIQKYIKYLIQAMQVK